LSDWDPWNVDSALQAGMAGSVSASDQGAGSDAVIASVVGASAWGDDLVSVALALLSILAWDLWWEYAWSVIDSALSQVREAFLSPASDSSVLAVGAVSVGASADVQWSGSFANAFLSVLALS
jgi:hypothetical protein